MKVSITLSCVFLLTSLAGCDMRSETAKREMEKFNGTPTPTITPGPTEAPIDPADIVQVDSSIQGDAISVDGYDQKKSIACTKLNRVSLNGGRSVITIKGPCRQLTINGDGNQINSDAAFEIVLNGDKNTVHYMRYINGKRPIITDNAGGNTVEKVGRAVSSKP